MFHARSVRRVAELTGKTMQTEYVDQNRDGDHICYISDLPKMKAHYPGWTITKPLAEIFGENVRGWQGRMKPSPQ